MFWLILAAIAGFLWWALATEKQKRKLIADQNATFMASREGWDIYISAQHQQLIGLSPAADEVILGTVHDHQSYSIKDVVAVEVLKDGATITTTDRGSQLAGAAIGGLAFGGVGMLLGGLSGSQTSRSMVHSLSIKVIVDDRTNPFYVIDFIKLPQGSKGVDPSYPLAKPMFEAADRQHAMLVTALRKHAQGQVSAPPQPALVTSRTDELQRLWDLKSAGALTDEEFAIEKNKLLSSTTES